ncbi:MAG: tripartite tricarboxylate transporter substrate binding protein [Alphaproteobacteria bacterium]|nr:tripartite tricarboxylate transporter substrate binding protein [Alphaproteobacteria bacterium]
MKTYKILGTLCSAWVLAFTATQAQAQPAGYPNKPIRLIVPAGSGDSCDILSRLIAPKLGERLGQNIVVDNKPGSGGQLGLTLIKQAPADGYTLGCGQGGNMVVVPLAYAKVAYDSRKDFAPVSMMASNFLALMVRPDAPFKTTQELIAFAKANPGKVTFGTNGEGAFLHFATEQLSQMAGYEYLHVPYKSMSDVFTQMLGNQIDATLASYISVQPMAASGKMRMLGIARSQRLPDVNDVPTLNETVSGFTSGGWFGVIAPAGTSKEIVAFLNREVNWVLRQHDVQLRMKQLGLDIHNDTPELFTQMLERDFVEWGKVLKKMNFKPM